MTPPDPWPGFERVAAATMPARPELGFHDANALGAWLNSYLHFGRTDVDEPARAALAALLGEWAVPARGCLVYGAPPGTPALRIGTAVYRVGPPPDAWAWYAVIDARLGQVRLYRRLELD